MLLFAMPARFAAGIIISFHDIPAEPTTTFLLSTSSPVLSQLLPRRCREDEMATVEQAGRMTGEEAGFFARERTIAKPGFSRWLVPPAALCVHLCIAQAYALSVFTLPMTKLLGITQSAPGDWKLTELGWVFSIAMVFLRGSAAVFGRWVEEGGPRKAMFTAALC